MLREVMDRLSPKEMQIQDKRGRWYEMRVRPYLTAEKKIDGAVLSFIDINSLMHTEAGAETKKSAAKV